mgnify:CR=1 FL=1
MTYQVEEVEHERDKNIVIRLKGEDASFQASAYGVSIYLTEDIADKIAFHIRAIIEDRFRAKEIQNNAGQNTKSSL